MIKVINPGNIPGNTEASWRKKLHVVIASLIANAASEHPDHDPLLSVIVNISCDMCQALQLAAPQEPSMRARNRNVLDTVLIELKTILLSYRNISINIFTSTTSIDKIRDTFGHEFGDIATITKESDVSRGMSEAYVAEPAPDIMVVLTDGATPWPNEGPPGVHVVVVIVGSTEEQLVDAGWTVPDWATIVYVS